MSARGLRVVPRDEERATWCIRCQRLARIGVSPLLSVESCPRCQPNRITWREAGRRLAIALLLLGWVLAGMATLGYDASREDAHMGESAFPRPAETR